MRASQRPTGEDLGKHRGPQRLLSQATGRVGARSSQVADVAGSSGSPRNVLRRDRAASTVTVDRPASQPGVTATRASSPSCSPWLTEQAGRAGPSVTSGSSAASSRPRSRSRNGAIGDQAAASPADPDRADAARHAVQQHPASLLIILLDHPAGTSIGVTSTACSIMNSSTFGFMTLLGDHLAGRAS